MNYKATESKLFFFATTNNNWCLWESDGTTEGTVNLCDTTRRIYPGFSSEVVNNIFYYSITDLTRGGYELWKSDGTPTNTVMVKDFGTDSQPPQVLTKFGNALYFFAAGPNGFDLWKSDDVETIKLKDTKIASSSLPSTAMTVVGNELFFFGNRNSNGVEIWKSDGTTDGTVLVANASNYGADVPVGFRNKLFLR